MPPITTAGTAPSSAAATPDSNAPSSFDARMNTDSSALTRPRSSGGVSSGTSVPRISTLTMSAPASTASARMDSGKLVDSPNTTVAAPNVPTATNRMRPTLCRRGRAASTTPTPIAPMPGAARNRPLPSAPTCSTSVANTGSSAVAPPNSTAARSSEMAPSSAGVARTKRMPAVTSRHVAVARSADHVRGADRRRQRGEEDGAEGRRRHHRDVRRRVADRLQAAGQRRSEDRRRLPGDRAERDDARPARRAARWRRATG